MNLMKESNHARTLPPVRNLILAALALMAMVVAGPVFADSNTCSSNSKSGGTVTFTLPSPIMIPPGAAIGTILWTSSPVTPVNFPVFSSCGTNVNNGLENATSGGPSAGNTLYPTNLSWLSFKILDSTGTALKSFPNQPFPSGSDTTGAANAEIMQPFQLQLVITSTATSGNQTLQTGPLVTWDFTLGGGKIFTADTFLIVGASGPINIIQPCVIAVDPTTVTLPAVSASAFATVGSTTGTTPFQIKLTNCPTGSQLGITLSTSNPQAGATGVIAPTAGAGYAQNVGVQVLTRGTGCNASGTPAALTFDTPIGEGATPSGSGTCNLPFAAQYCQTASPATAGNVTATATYTLTYQ